MINSYRCYSSVKQFDCDDLVYISVSVNTIYDGFDNICTY